MGVQVVHHQHNPVLVRVVLVHQLLHLVRPVHFRPPVRHSDPPPPFQRRKQHEQVAHPVALVFVIIRDCRSGAERARQSRFLHLLFAGLVQAHQHLIVPELTLVDLKHVLHGADELGVALGRDAPALFQPRLEFVFFSVLRTVSGWMLSTISHSTSRSANNLSVQRARPSGGSPQASAIRWASAAPSSFFGRRCCCSLRPKAASIPSSTQRRRIRSTVALAISRDRATSRVVRQASVFPRFIAKQQDACMGLLVRCCPSLGNQGLQFLLLFRGQFDTVLLSRHDPSP